MPAMEVVVASKVLFNLMVSAVILSGSLPALAQSQPTGSWSTENVSSGVAYNLSSPYGGSATDGTYMYIFGGYQYGASTIYPQYYQVCRRYDPVSNAWATMAFMNYPTYYNAGTYYNGRVYSFGGYNTNSGWVATWQYYQISTNTWSLGPTNMTSPRYYHAVAELNGTIYMTAGYNPNSGPVTTHEAFNPSTNQWSSLAATPGYIYYHGLAAVPAVNKLYSLGGYGVAQYSGINYEYDVQTNAWTTRAPISNGSAQQNIFYTRPIVLNNRVYIPGGQNANTGIVQTTYEYNPFTNTWAQRANMAYLHYMHAAVAINGKGYVYGGPNYPTMCEEFTPPSFGSPPFAPANLTQTGSRPETALQALPDTTQFNGWTNNQITFTADVTDPDAGQQVLFRVQVKPQSASWTQAAQITNLATPLGAQGTKTLTYTIPADGGYDWRWRVEDAFSNSHPVLAGTWIEAFGTETVANTASPDFRSDQLPPTEPVAVGPHNTDIQVTDPVIGQVTLNWTEATDNGPVAGISYELQVATDGGFNQVEAQIFSTAGTSSYPVALTVSRYDKFWRMRARDIGGNLSNWSPALNFRVTYNDGVDHSAGDAKKACGMSASATASITGALLGVLILAFAAGRRTIRA
jgi:hypothetical protein